jgi:hypothetical protein
MLQAALRRSARQKAAMGARKVVASSAEEGPAVMAAAKVPRGRTVMPNSPEQVGAGEVAVQSRLTMGERRRAVTAFYGAEKLILARGPWTSCASCRRASEASCDSVAGSLPSSGPGPIDSYA